MRDDVLVDLVSIMVLTCILAGLLVVSGAVGPGVIIDDTGIPVWSTE